MEGDFEHFIYNPNNNNISIISNACITESFLGIVSVSQPFTEINNILPIYLNFPYCNNGSSLPESIETNKVWLKTIDILGRETTNNKGFQLHIYDDGSVEKKYVIK
jgi:hypothetical protein